MDPRVAQATWVHRLSILCGLLVGGEACVASANSPVIHAEPEQTPAMANEAPPSYAPAEVRGPAPDANSVWIAGYWHWDDARYVWIPGRWEVASPTGVWSSPRFWSNGAPMTGRGYYPRGNP
jgi:WXXGXW repeat (2 copies)